MINNKDILNSTIGEIVADNYRTASVFSKYGIDFCCKGNRTIENACEKKAINKAELIQDLNLATEEKEIGQDFNTMPLHLLIDHILYNHHQYIREKIPPLEQFLNKVQKVHGERHPELLEIYDLFISSARDLELHLQKEERILFPFIKQMVEAEKNEQAFEIPHFGTIENPIAMMMDDHSLEGERFRKISELSQEYTPPAEACNTYKVSFSMLDEFEKNLHKHIHLENNILFPKSIKLQKRLIVND